MSNEKIYLGKVSADLDSFACGEAIYLEKHEWQCGWYWSFGWIGNKNLHCHLDGLISDSSKANKHEASKLFESTNISDKDWWLLRDLFMQAYALRNAAEVYQYGGHQCSKKGITDMIASKDTAALLNADLKKVLDVAWDIACVAVKPKEVAA